MIKALQAFAKEMRSLLWPDKYFAWQTLLLLSLFSWIVALTVRGIEGGDTLLVEFLSTLSWIFLTSAIWWALSANPVKVWGFSISPWITGATFCLFAFRPWEEDRFRWALSAWPLVSVAIAVLPDFVNWELKFSPPKKDKQPSLFMMLLVNLLLTSWILFFFRVQDWVGHYPSLLVSSLDRSAFVYDFVTKRDPDENAQGIPLLESTAEAITGELEGLPWYQTERWLYTRKNRLEAIAQRMNNNLAAPDEQIFWQIAVPEPKRLGDGYLLTLRADWLGPAKDRSFYVEKNCKITPDNQTRNLPAASSNAVSPEATAAEKNRQRLQQVSQMTAVDCGEDEATVQWNG